MRSSAIQLQFKKNIGKLREREELGDQLEVGNIYHGLKILGLGASIYFIKRKLKGDLFAERKALVMDLCNLEARKTGGLSREGLIKICGSNL